MLTPVDIENKDFKKVMRGYDSLEVDAFLKDLISDYEKLYRENSTMKDKIEMLSTSLSNYRSMEETMQNAMIVAQSTADDIKKNAAERANNIVAQAEIKAKEIVDNAEKEISNLNAKYQALKGEIDAFKSRIRALVLTYSKMLDEFPGDNAPAVNNSNDKADTKTEDFFEETKKQESEPEEIKKEEKPQTDIYEELKKVPKMETSDNPRLEKQNAMLEEILTQRAERKEAESPFKPGKEAGSEVKEVIINLSNDEKKSSSSGSFYDVFSDPTI